MADAWREVPMAEIDWSALKPTIGRPVHALRRLSRPWSNPTEYGSGSWHDLTLGDVADMGRREIMRHLDVGEAALVALQKIIDMAAAGSLPMISATGRPAHDALRPSQTTENPRHD